MDIFQWIIPWDFSIAFLTTMIIAAGLYYAGCKKIPVSAWRQFSFWSGLVLIYAVSHTLYDYYAQYQFFIHRIQHTVQHHIGPFLIVLSRPIGVLAAGTPPKVLSVLKKLTNWQPIRFLTEFLFHPVIQICLFVGLILFWLIPYVHFYAMFNPLYYRAMNWGMIINGLMFWGLVLSPYEQWEHRYDPGWRIGMMLAIVPPQIIVGMILFSLSYEVYSVYGICGNLIPGVSQLADQQLGGLILWIPASMMSVIGILIVLRRSVFK